MGSRADVSELLSQCLWSEEGSYLAEVAKVGFPCVAKVLRGQYQSLGQPSFSNPSLVSHVLLVSAGKQLSIAAQCVKFKNCRQRVVPFGPTLAIPNSFEGHFEILSEDGRSVPCIQNVSALSRKFPDSCLVREPIKGFKPDTKSTSPTVINDNVVIGNGLLGGGDSKNCISNNNSSSSNYKVSDKTRVVQPGEILILVGEVCVPTGKKVQRFLRCFDSKGQTVFLNSSQKGKFSPLAGADSIGGVHTTKNILNKRMPMMVRLVDGKPPVMPSSKSSSFKFVPELRLFSTIQEELIFAMPLSQSSKDSPVILPLPLSVPLKFQICRNMGEVEGMKEFCRIQEKMKTLVDLSKSSIQIYDINLKKELRFDGRQWKSYTPPIFLSPSTPEMMILSGSQSPPPLSTSTTTHHQQQQQQQSMNNYEIPDVQDYEDIDQIYDYVRGIKPGPPKILHGKNSSKVLSSSRSITNLAAPSPTAILISPTNPVNVAKQRQLTTKCSIAFPSDPHNNNNNNSNSNNNNSEIIISDTPPEPPPIETIPTNKNKLLLGGGGVSVSVGNIVKVAIQSDNKLETRQEFKNLKNSRHQHPLHNHNHNHQTTTNANTTSINILSANPTPHHMMMMNNNNNNANSNSHSSSNNNVNSHNDNSNTNSSSRDTPAGTNTSASSSEKVRVKHLYVKHNNSNSSSSNNNNNINNSVSNMNGFQVDSSCGGGGLISGSPTNRIIFRRSPIFDCRYKSMNDLNRSSLESGASVSSQKMRYFQHNHHGLNVNLLSNSSHNNNSSHGNLNLNVNFNVKASSRHQAIFRPKSLTNLNMKDLGGLLTPSNSTGASAYHNNSSNHHHHHHHPKQQQQQLHNNNSSHNNSSNNINCSGNNISNNNANSNNLGGVSCKKKIEMVVPSHQHAPSPSIELLQKLVPRSSQRESSQRRKSQQPGTLYL